MGSAFGLITAVLSTLWTWFLLAFSGWVGYQVTQGKSLEALALLDVLPTFLRTPLQHQADSTIVITLAGVIAAFVVYFLAGYVLQALVDYLRLALVRSTLHRADRLGWLTHTLPAQGSQHKSPLHWRWLSYPHFSRLWREYAETLHVQNLPTPEEEPQRVSYRSTLPAETIFSTQALVNVPMRVEFFRHLPGILTGAGIVSTFAGILLGLSEFNPAVDAQQITLQLKNLFSGITTAFIASFFAIFTAILVTILEKFLLHWRYAQVVALQQDVDDLFRAGVEPEYLAQLVEQGPGQLAKLHNDLARLTQQLSLPMSGGGSGFVAAGSVQELASDADTAQTVKTVMSEFLLEFSQLLQRTVDSYGRRREEGRSFEIQLLSVGERLDVAMSEFANLVLQAKEEMHSHHAATLAAMEQQLVLLTRQVAQQESAQQIREQQMREQQVDPASSRFAEAIEKQTEVLQGLVSALHDWRHSTGESERQGQWRLQEGMQEQVLSLQQMHKSLQQFVEEAVPARELLQQWQQAQQLQEEGRHSWQEQVRELAQRVPDKEDFARLQQAWQQGQQEWLQSLQSLRGQVVEQLQQLEEQIVRQHGQLQEQLQSQLQQWQEQAGVWSQWRTEQSAQWESGQRQIEHLLQQLAAQWQQNMQELGEQLRLLLQSLQSDLARQWQEQERVQGEWAERLLAGLRQTVTAERQEQQESQGLLQKRLEEQLQGVFAQQLQEQRSSQALQAEQLSLQLQGELAGVWQKAEESRSGILSALMAQLKEEMSGQWQRQEGSQVAQMEQLLAALQKQWQEQEEAGARAGEQTRAHLQQWQEEWQSAWQRQQGMQSAQLEQLLTQVQLELAALRVQAQEAEAGRVQVVTQEAEATPEREAKVAEEWMQGLRGQVVQLLASQQSAQAEWASRLAMQLQDLLQHYAAANRSQVQELAEQLQQQVALSMQSQNPAEQTEALAEQVIEQLSGRLEQSLGSLSHGLDELRERLAVERSTIVSTVADWREDSSRSEREQSQQLDQKLGDVINHVTSHQQHLTRIIGELNQTLSHDLEGMREGLLSRNEASTQQMLQRVSDLGRGLEEVISTVGQEQTVFIEMLGERLEALRRRLRSK
ncbi:hypothetical protein [Candidatus Magnetaquicoccus inordinatus]|uniref:hypothetical protein n=1 Tax=Candidatus Magnetaquicoccus inordinatus TaxID=2496818 RepID=UPI00102CFCFC|nr:hypothetical protein [Candidatus Magnetaquicoccus inordinatus]